MNARPRILPVFRAAVLSANALVVSISASTAAAQAKPASSNEEQATVDCRLPPQIRTLGKNATYLAAGRQIRTSVAECKVRGGSYQGQGPGALAGRGSDTFAARTSVPVIVGGDNSRAGCPRTGLVSGLSAKGTLSVRSGPATASQRIDGMVNGQKVFMCDWSAGGGWVGVVYAGKPGGDCGLSKYLATARAYSGPCHSGWVSSKYVK